MKAKPSWRCCAIIAWAVLAAPAFAEESPKSEPQKPAAKAKKATEPKPQAGDKKPAKPAPAKPKRPAQDKKTEPMPPQPKEMPAAKPDAKPDNKPATKPEEKPTEKPTEKPAPKPVEKILVALDVSQVDADYWVQGEYLGEMSDGASHREALGLQVVAQGQGKFLAMLYFGGLPGTGWNAGMGYQKFAAESQNGKLVLANDSYEISIAGSAAEIRHKVASLSGSLPRVERRSATLGASPPPGAVVLFNGEQNASWTKANIAPDRLLMPGAITSFPVGDFRLHLEYRIPYKPTGKGQDRGNSGLYIQTRYELQILDSFGLRSEFNDGGSLYRQRAPDLNMCFAPLVWQTYDVWFRAARFNSGGEKIANARLTLWHNGVPVHNQVEISNKTGAGKVEGPEPLPLILQDHGNPVRFRNIWLVPGNQG